MKKSNCDVITSLLQQKKLFQDIIYKVKGILDSLEEYKLYAENHKLNEIDDKIQFYMNSKQTYETKLQKVLSQLDTNCQHVIINDSIDISPDQSQDITYCEICETTF